MAEKISFELVSPERLLISEATDMVVVPGVDGDFGVLAGHAPLISVLRPGVISMYEGRARGRRIFVDGGFVEITPKRCTVLAETAEPLEGLDRATADKRISAAETAVRDALDPAAAEAARKQLASARALATALAG